MNFEWMKEGIGYAASLIILVSLLMTNVFRLRVINGIGSLAFALYGWWIGSWPVCLINAVIAGIDGWYLLQSLRASAIYELSQVGQCSGAEYLKRFFLFHERDLLQFPPVFAQWPVNMRSCVNEVGEGEGIRDRERERGRERERKREREKDVVGDEKWMSYEGLLQQ